MHMMWTPLDSTVYSSSSINPMATNSAANSGVCDGYSPPTARTANSIAAASVAAANHFFASAVVGGSATAGTGSALNMPAGIKAATETTSDMKNMHHHHLASFVQSMSNFHQFQSSNPNVSLNSSNHSPFHSSNSSGASIGSHSGGGPIKKKANPVPSEHKTPAYFERRKKNNDSARKSREMRRLKEEENQRRNAFLEQENTRLFHENRQMAMELINARNAYNTLFLQHQQIQQQQQLPSPYA